MKRLPLLTFTALCTVVGACDSSSDAGPTVDASNAAIGKADGAGSSSAPVELVMATPCGFGSHGSCGGATFLVRVHNLGFEKDLAVRYEPQGGGEWIERPLEYVETSADGTELWAVSLVTQNGEGPFSTSCSCTDEFAIRYGVGGDEFWDSNNGHNYQMNGTVLGRGTNVALASAEKDFFNPGTRGTVVVRNVAFEKEVEVVYTTDGWETADVAPATFGSSAGGDTERWHFDLDVAEDDTVEMAVSYGVGGQTFWDNNAQGNYTFDASQLWSFSRNIQFGE